MIWTRSGIFVLGTVFLISCSMGLRHTELINGSVVPYVTKGDGKPAVIFEAGIGDGLGLWEPVFERVAEFTTALAYSRAGYTGSTNYPNSGSSRSADEVARMAKTLLDKANFKGPFLFVGHSMGGMYVLRFAKLFPKDVAGIVLVDGRPREFTRKCEEAGLSPCRPPESLVLAAPPHIAAEIRGIAQSEEQTPTPQELGNLPVTVIVATKPPPGAPIGGQPVWLRVQKDFADAVEDGRYVIAEGAGHYVHRDAPELVVQRIREMVDKIRKSY